MTEQEQLAGVVTEDEWTAIDGLIDRLVLRFPKVPAETVEELVRSVHEEFEGALLRNFIPVLVEHDVLVELRERGGQGDLSRDGERAEPVFDR
jgi:hypothetical protein